MSIILTQNGKEEVQRYIRECEAKRKEIIDAGIDTANETELPTESDIISDIDEFVDADGDYYNCWGVTDNHNADNNLCLQDGIDFKQIYDCLLYTSRGSGLFRDEI